MSNRSSESVTMATDINKDPNSTLNLEHGDNKTTDAWDNATFMGITFLQKEPIHASIYVTAVILSLVVGTFGNLMVIGAHIKNKKLRKAGNMLIINLALADLCVTAIADPMCILGATKGKQFFARFPWLCEVIAAFCLTACFCAFFSLSFITFNRFLFVCYNNFYYRVFTKRKILVFCMLIWVTAFGLEAPNFTDLGGHFFDHKNQQCMWNRLANRAYTLCVTVGLIITPLVGMVTAYVIIFIKIFRTKSALLRFTVSQILKRNIVRRELTETFRTCRTTCLIVAAFVICWTPYAVIVTIDHLDRLPGWMHMWATFLAHTHSVVNFLIYLSHKDYRDTFKLMCLWSSRRSTTNHSSLYALSHDPQSETNSSRAK